MGPPGGLLDHVQGLLGHGRHLALRLQLNHLLEVGPGLVVLALAQVREAAPVVGLHVLRVERDRLPEVLDGVRRLPRVQEVDAHVVEHVRVRDLRVVQGRQVLARPVHHLALERGLGGDRTDLVAAGLGGEHLVQVLERLVVLLLLDVGEADLLVDHGREIGPHREHLLVRRPRVGEAAGLVGLVGRLGRGAQLRGRAGPLEGHLQLPEPRRLRGKVDADLLRLVALGDEVEVPVAGHDAPDDPTSLLVRLDGGAAPALGALGLDLDAGDGLAVLLVGDGALEPPVALPVLGGDGPAE
jgi:hypothetical protein